MPRAKTQDLDCQIADVKRQRRLVQYRIAEVKAYLSQFEQSDSAKKQASDYTSISGRERQISEYLAELYRLLPAEKHVIIVSGIISQQGTRSQIVLPRPAYAGAASRDSGTIDSGSIDYGAKTLGNSSSVLEEDHYSAVRGATDLGIFTVEMYYATEYTAADLFSYLDEEAIDYGIFVSEEKEDFGVSSSKGTEETWLFSETVEQLVDYRTADTMGNVTDYDQDNEVMVL